MTTMTNAGNAEIGKPVTGASNLESMPNVEDVDIADLERTLVDAENGDPASQARARAIAAAMEGDDETALRHLELRLRPATSNRCRSSISRHAGATASCRAQANGCTTWIPGHRGAAPSFAAASPPSSTTGVSVQLARSGRLARRRSVRVYRRARRDGLLEVMAMPKRYEQLTGLRSGEREHPRRAAVCESRPARGNREYVPLEPGQVVEL